MQLEQPKRRLKRSWRGCVKGASGALARVQVKSPHDDFKSIYKESGDWKRGHGFE